MLQNFGIQNRPKLESNLQQEQMYQMQIKMLIVCWVGFNIDILIKDDLKSI